MCLTPTLKPEAAKKVKKVTKKSASKRKAGEALAEPAPTTADAEKDASAPPPAKKVKKVKAAAKPAKKAAAKAEDEEAAEEPKAADAADAGAVAELTPKEFLEKNEIQIKDGELAVPFQSFKQIADYINKYAYSVAHTHTHPSLPPSSTFPFVHHRPIERCFEKAGFSAPSVIQSVCWPVALKGSDLIAIAKTGSGKTLGFLIPAFHMALKDMPTDPRQPRIQYGAPPTAMVIAPTRELAVQIHEEATKFGNAARIVSVAVFGGVPSGKQIRELRRGSHIVIATPGRLTDLLDLDNPPVTNLNNIKYAVLDEADQMLDMGFEPAITALMKMLPEQHQTLMFTATWPKAIQKIARNFLKNPVHVQVGADGLKANSSITQEFHVVEEWEKEAMLVKTLAKMEDEGKKESVLVFVNRKANCDTIARAVKRGGMQALSIHGDLDQAQRMAALKAFKEEKVRIVIATDVAARGLDIDGVGLVINYDFPSSGCEIWVHRVGRTGRAGRKGRAVTFFDVHGPEKKFADELLAMLQGSETPIPDWLVPLAETASFSNARADAKKDFFKNRANGGGWGGGGGRGGGGGSSWGGGGGGGSWGGGGGGGSWGGGGGGSWGGKSW